MAMIDDPEIWKEQERFYNFLQHYDLHKYHQRFLAAGVSRISHLKVMDDKDLENVGLTRPERNRLYKKLEENFSISGLIKKSVTRKRHKFDGPAPESAHRLEGPDTHHTASLIAKEEVKLGRKIGEGAHGAVHEGTWANVHGSVAVAVKTLYGKQEVQAAFIREADSMRILNHPHIIRLYGIVLSSPLMLIEELAPFGNLQHHLVKNGKWMNIQVFHTYACQIADAMKYLEEHRIVHRDLATRNILLSSEDYIKLSDFGMARVLDEHSDVYNLSNLQARIPVAWTALEALSHAKFSSASDVWSYGVTLWEIYSLGRTPWEGLTPIEIRDVLAQGERLGRPERCPTDVYRVMQSCWEAQVVDRPSFTVIYQRIQTTSPKRVRAVKPHKIMGDEDSLSFASGDILFVIEKPKAEWTFGMKVSGEIGLFQADHVTTELDPVGELKEKVQSGKAKAADLPISQPTFVSHEYHWGFDGNKWASESSREQELIGHGRLASQTSNGSSRDSSKSPPVLSPSYKPLISRSPTPGSSRHSPQSPLAINLAQTESAFVGTPRYAPNVASATPNSEPLVNIDSGITGLHLSTPQRSMSRQLSENDQYVTVVGASILQENGMPAIREDQENEIDHNGNYDYLMMQPYPTRLQQQAHQYQNVPLEGQQQQFAVVGMHREEAPAYAVSDARDRVHSSESSLSNTPDLISPTHSLLDNTTCGINGARLPDPLMPTPATNHPVNRQQGLTQGVGVQSQFDFATVPTYTQTTAAIVPTSGPVQYENYNIPRYNPSSSGNGSDLPSSWDQGEFGIARARPKTRQRPLSVTGPSQNGSNGNGWGKSISFDADETNSTSRGKKITPPLHRRASAGCPGKPIRRPHDYELVASPPPDWETKQLGARTPESEIRQKLFSPDSDQQPLINIAQSVTKVPVRKLSSADSRDVGPEPVPHYESILLADFPDASQEMCQRALEMHSYNIMKAKEEVMIQLLLAMEIACVDATDCKRALSHCQWKLDRAAAWLLDQSENILSRIS